MENNPFQLLEGVTIAGYAIGAVRGYIYIRGEYEHQGAHPRARDRAGPGGRDARGRRDAGSSSFDFDITLYRGRAPTSTARRRRCSRASRANAACRG